MGTTEDVLTSTRKGHEERPRTLNDDGSLLSVRNLGVSFGVRGQRRVQAVDEVSFDIRPGEHVGLVGESGSGKSVTSLAIMGLLPKRAVEVEGEVRYADNDLLRYSRKQMSELRGRDITVNAVAPGPTATPLFLDGKDEQTIATLAKAAPLERLGRPEDIAQTVAFLAGPGRWINGQVVYANGGLA